MVDESSRETAADPLSGVLEAVRLRGSVFGAGELGAPWGVQTPGIPELVCYVVVRGAAHLALLDAPQAQVAIASGDVVLVAAGRAHALRDSPGSAVVSFDELRRAAGDGPGPLRWGGSGPRTTLVCGSLAIDEAGRALLGSALPGFLHLPAEAAGPGLLGVLGALASEVAAPRPGSGAALTRLAELVFIHALRASIARGVAGAGWLLPPPSEAGPARCARMSWGSCSRHGRRDSPTHPRAGLLFLLPPGFFSVSTASALLPARAPRAAGSTLASAAHARSGRVALIHAGSTTPGAER
ncbi:hypothetical protein BE15_10645 [Sorangium cellulosum]|uniref:AraC-type transcription regulator ligand-binding domain-containing protein n=1 Tax=Sorangium cellulosum TaxID=56 RepID=A0A150QKB6_SORCE|nr:hypothetical protein BE15_10645 [Sorangium cellulosum]